MTRKLRISRSFPRTAFDIEMEPTSAEDLNNEEETWNKLQLIRTLPVDMTVKRKLRAEVSVHLPLKKQNYLTCLMIDNTSFQIHCAESSYI